MLARRAAKYDQEKRQTVSHKRVNGRKAIFSPVALSARSAEMAVSEFYTV